MGWGEWTEGLCLRSIRDDIRALKEICMIISAPRVIRVRSKEQVSYIRSKDTNMLQRMPRLALAQVPTKQAI